MATDLTRGGTTGFHNGAAPFAGGLKFTYDFAYDGVLTTATTYDIINIPAGFVSDICTVQIITAVDNAAAGGTITAQIGTSGDPNGWFTDAGCDLTTVATLLNDGAYTQNGAADVVKVPKLFSAADKVQLVYTADVAAVAGKFEVILWGCFAAGGFA